MMLRFNIVMVECQRNVSIATLSKTLSQSDNQSHSDSRIDTLHCQLFNVAMRHHKVGV